MISNNVYYFNSGTSWVVPDGVTGIKVECYGSSFGASNTSSTLDGNYSGGSYSRSDVINVNGGATVYMNIGSLGGNTWFNITNATPTSSSPTSTACLAVGGNTAPASQIAANCGDVKYKGGNGVNVNGMGGVTTASGGQAGPNGNGADVVGPFTNTLGVPPYNGFIYYSGGGANGGSSGSLGTPPYGRSGTGTVGSGAYWNGTSLIYAVGTDYGGFIDPVGQYSYLNNILVPNEVGLTNYGPVGGGVVLVNQFTECPNTYSLQDQEGFIVVTLLYGRKFIVVNTTGSSSFTVPSDFSSLVSLEAVGAGGNGHTATSGAARYGGGGGGGYSKNTDFDASGLLAGSTIIYTSVAAAGVGTAVSSYLSLIGNVVPDNYAEGVLANSGGNAVTNTGGAGATTSLVIASPGFFFGGGTGGAGTTSSRFNAGGGGGAGGPLGAGGNGGNGNTSAVNTGSGGGGGANNGTLGSSGTTTTSGNGGTGSSGAGAGGNGNSSTNTSGQTAGASGPSGGGGAGGGGFNTFGSGGGGAVNNSVYQIGGGQGGFTFARRPDQTILAYPGSGGGGGPNSTFVLGGQGLVVFAYTPNPPLITSGNGNFFMFF